MADETKRVIDQTTDSSLSAGDFVIVDSQSEGTRKFDLGTELTDIKQDLLEIEGGSVPTNVRQAIYSLLEDAVYISTGHTSDIATVQSWAAEVTAISLNKSSTSITGANTEQLVATTIPSGGTVIWSSSNTAVATVDSSGLITAVSNGTATITAFCGELSATCVVTVDGIATLSSISASYTQTGTVYDTDDLDDVLTAGTLVVTATYSDSSTATISNDDCTLSGTLEVGTSTITVSYGGETATFNVTVTEAVPENLLYKWDNLGVSLIDSVNGAEATTTGTQDSVNGCISFNATSKYIDFGKIYNYDRTYEIKFGASNAAKTNTHARFFAVDSDSATDSGGGAVFAFRGNYGFAFYNGSSWESTLVSGTNERNMFANSTLSIYIDSVGKAYAYKDGVLLGSTVSTFKTYNSNLRVYIGSSQQDDLYNLEIKSMTVYSGEEI